MLRRLFLPKQKAKRVNDEIQHKEPKLILDFSLSHLPPSPSTRLWAAAAATHDDDDDDDDKQCFPSSMASASVAGPPRPRLVNRSGLSDSSKSQESGSSYAFSARESNLPAGHHLVPTIAVSALPDVPTPVEPTRKNVAFEHRQGRQALDLSRDKPLPAIPVSSTTNPVRRSCLRLTFNAGAGG